jgi:hypothetical protein
MREPLSALRLGQRCHAVEDGRGGAEDEALHLGCVHRARLRLEPRGLQKLAHASGDDAVKLAGVGDHFTLRRLGQRAWRAGPVGRATVAVAIDALLPRVRLIGYQPSVARQRGRGRSFLWCLWNRTYFRTPPENEEAGSP